MKRLWKLPELWTQSAAPTAPWKTPEPVFHSYHRPSSSSGLNRETESANLSTKPGQPHNSQPILELICELVWDLEVGSRLGFWDLELGASHNPGHPPATQRGSAGAFCFNHSRSGTGLSPLG